MEEYPPPSDASDSDCRGPFGDSHIPGAYEYGEFSREDEIEIMYGNREERERMFREVEEIEERRRQREQQEGTAEDVDMENQELLEAFTTPTSLEEPNFYSNMVDELRDGVDPISRIVIEAAMEAPNLALSTNRDDLGGSSDTAMEAHENERTQRQRLRIWREDLERGLKDVECGREVIFF